MGRSLADQCVQAVEEVTGLKYSDMMEEQAKGRVQRPVESQTLSASLEKARRDLKEAQARARREAAIEERKRARQLVKNTTTPKEAVDADRVVQALHKDPALLAAVKHSLHLIPVVHPWRSFGPTKDVKTDLYIRKDVTGRDAASVWKTKHTERLHDGELVTATRWAWKVSVPKVGTKFLFTFDMKEGDTEFLDVAMRLADEMLVTLAPDLVFIDPSDNIGVRMGFKEPTQA